MNPPQTFLYVLRLVDRLRIETGLTDGDNAATARHFQRLKERLAEGIMTATLYPYNIALQRGSPD